MSEPTKKLSGRELDAEIHVRVMGFPLEAKLVGDGKSADTALHLEPQDAAWRVRSDVDTYWERFSPDGAERVIIAPLYSTSIEAAWQIVQAFRTGVHDHAAAVIDMRISDVIIEPDCYCHIYGPDIAGGEAWARSMPEAICRAALAAMEGNNL